MTAEPTFFRVLEELGHALAARGFDLVHGACAGWYNGAVDPAYRVPDLGSPRSLAAVIGNTRALWPHFVEAVARDHDLAANLDPLDTYTETSIRSVLGQLALPYEVRFSHELPPRRVAMQRAAHVAGLAHLSPSGLSVHPTYGPWIGLRAIAVLPLEGPGGDPPAWTAPCDCTAHCMPRFVEALAATQGADPVDSAGIARHWRLWVSVRDACPVGRQHRYSDEQIRYHYTKDKAFIARGTG